MTLDDLMKKNQGEWQDDVAVVQIDGYYWRVATRSAGKVELTPDGRHWIGVFGQKGKARASKKPVQEPVQELVQEPAAPTESVEDLEL